MWRTLQRAGSRLVSTLGGNHDHRGENPSRDRQGADAGIMKPMLRKNPRAVTFARKGGNSHGPARATKRTPQDTSDRALISLLKRLKATSDPNEIRRLSDQIERVVFHKQFRNA